MPEPFCEPDPSATRLIVVDKGGWDAWSADQPNAVRHWLAAQGFRGSPGSACPVPSDDGRLAFVVAVLGEAASLWDWAAVADAVPGGTYRLEPEPPDAETAERAALAWALNAFRDDRFRASETPPVRRVLCWPTRCDRAAVVRAAEATELVRTLINTPANLCGPAELAASAVDLAAEFGAEARILVGRELLEENYPAVFAVGAGAAAERAPRLIDVRWGEARGPKVTLVGKGVAFDTGGLDIKPASAMKLMKKDMGGAAAVLGLARMVMSAGLPVRLRVLIPAVENAVSEGALRPLDIVRTRSGRTIEIGHTDAEGRVILADALFEAASEQPDLIVDFATLTGAARVALGPDVPALFCNDEALAETVLAAARRADDPLWRLPLWEPYRKAVEGRLADVTNAPEGGAVGSGYAGAITAALFLQTFVTPLRPWAHVDMMAWNLVSRPGRPEGGEAMAMRAFFALLRGRYGG